MAKKSTTATQPAADEVEGPVEVATETSADPDAETPPAPPPLPTATQMRTGGTTIDGETTERAPEDFDRRHGRNPEDGGEK